MKNKTEKQSENKNPDPMVKLPEEIQEQIFSFLNVEELLLASQVNKRWNNVITYSSQLWANQLKKSLPTYKVKTEKQRYFEKTKRLQEKTSSFIDIAFEFFYDAQSPNFSADLIDGTADSSLRLDDFLNVCSFRFLDIVKKAFEVNSEVLLKTINGFSLLHFLVSTQHEAVLEVIPFLIEEKKLDVDQGYQCEHRITPLCIEVNLAKKNDLLENFHIIEKLISCGANLEYLPLELQEYYSSEPDSDTLSLQDDEESSSDDSGDDHEPYQKRLKR